MIWVGNVLFFVVLGVNLWAQFGTRLHTITAWLAVAWLVIVGIAYSGDLWTLRLALLGAIMFWSTVAMASLINTPRR